MSISLMAPYLLRNKPKLLYMGQGALTTSIPSSFAIQSHIFNFSPLSLTVHILETLKCLWFPYSIQFLA